MRVWLTLLCACFFSGCAVQSLPPVPALAPANPADGTVRIRLTGISLSGVLKSEGAPVIEQVDRRDITGYRRVEANLLLIPAGKRELVFAQAFGREVAKATVDWELPRDRILVVRSARSGRNVEFWLEDEATREIYSRRFVGQIGFRAPPRTWKFVPID